MPVYPFMHLKVSRCAPQYILVAFREQNRDGLCLIFIVHMLYWWGYIRMGATYRGSYVYIIYLHRLLLVPFTYTYVPFHCLHHICLLQLLTLSFFLFCLYHVRNTVESHLSEL